MTRPKREWLYLIIGAALLSPIVGCLLGWGLGGFVWEARRPEWTPLGSPRGGASRIVGIAFPEDSSLEPPTVYIEGSSGGHWFYRPSLPEAKKWGRSEAACVPCGGWLQQTCLPSAFPVLPEYPGATIDCARYLPPIPDKDPELILRQYILLEDGTVWRWGRPAVLLSEREVFPACGLALGTLTAGVLAILVLKGAAPAARAE
jgi:hypothetical protein